MTVIGGACCLLFLLCFAMTREVVDSRSKASVGKDFRTLMTNRPWWIMNGVAIFNNFYNIIRGSAVAYLFANIIGGSHDVKILTFALTAGVFLCIGELVNMVSVPLAVPLSMKWGKKSTFMSALACDHSHECGVLVLPGHYGRYMGYGRASGGVCGGSRRRVAAGMEHVCRRGQLFGACQRFSLYGSDILFGLDGSEVRQCFRRRGRYVASQRFRI